MCKALDSMEGGSCCEKLACKVKEQVAKCVKPVASQIHFGD